MISQGQKMKLQQKLTPQQLLLMRLLQVPATVLEQTIKQEIERNPLLEDEHIGDELQSHSDDNEPQSDNDRNDEELDFESQEIDPFAENSYDDDEEDYRYREHQEYDRNSEEKDSPISAETSFTDYLLEQFNLKRLTPEQALIGHELIGSIDESGYLSRDIGLIANDMAFKQNIDVSPDQVEAVLKIVQTLDPAGVGARNLQECLAIQLNRMQSDYARHSHPDLDKVNAAAAIVEKYFNEFSKRHFDFILNRLSLTTEQLNQAINCIKKLNPKPGSSFSEGGHSDIHYIIPDFIVTNDENEGLSFVLNDHNLPEIRVSRYYTDMLQQMSQIKKPSKADRDTIHFIKEKAENARWFIEMLGQRRITLQKIMGTLIIFQQKYFTTGVPTDLKPMKLKDVADNTGYDISTISRVVTQKYVQTEFGTFPLKELFTKGFTTDEGESVSTDAIKHYLQEAIANENKICPLTDEELKTILNKKGYPLARRTVAKYRESLGIPVGRLRKELQK